MPIGKNIPIELQAHHAWGYFNKINMIRVKISATVLIIIPEIGYIKDIYITDYRRANTMFKLVYEAFIMYAIVSGYIFIRLRKSILLKIFFVLIFIGPRILVSRMVRYPLEHLLNYKNLQLVDTKYE